MPNRIGAHVSIAGGIQNAPLRASEEGCETFQCFTRSPQGGPAPALTDQVVGAFKKNMESANIASFVIHAPYYINLASLEERIRSNSIRVIREELERGTVLGGSYVMFHPGSYKDQSQDEAIAKVQESLTKILEGYSGTTRLLVEISAGAGNVLGDTFQENAAMVQAVTDHPGFGGICFDTCHAFASGYDFRTPPSKTSSQVRRLLAESRTGAMIGRVFKSRYTELYSIVFGVFAVLALWGSSAEGQTSVVDNLVRRYVEEEAFALDAPRHTTNGQLADISSMYAGTGGDGSIVSPAPSLDVVTVNESAMTAMTPPSDGYLDELSAQRSQMTEYTVQEGDLISFIASDFGVSIDTIVWANKLKDADSIAPGTVLRIPPVTGVIHIVQKGDTVASLAKKYVGEEARIIAYNRLPQDGILEAGVEVVIPGGKMPYTVPAAATGTATASRVAASTSQFAHLPDLGGYFSMPTTGRNWGRIHGRNGVDIANSVGTPIYAAAAGTVAIADAEGWNGGFGKYVKIIHPNGTETLYAHASKVLVSVGQVVGQGERIMLMGSTGRSTGPHLHFEVHGAKNPLAK